jgi:hypothetical protein
LLVSFFGFGFTIWGVLRSKAAAEAAKTAALQTQKDLKHLDTIMDFSTAITIMEEIKRHHRSGNWQILPDRYSALRQKLISIKSNHADISEIHALALQSAIQDFSDMEKDVERALMRNVKPTKVSRFNEIVSNQIDALNVVLIDIKNQMEVK